MKAIQLVCSSLFIMVLVVLLSTPQKSFAQNYVDEDAQGVVSYSYSPAIEVKNEKVNMLKSSGVDSEKTNSTDYLAASAGPQYFWLQLRDHLYKEVTGIKASRLEMVQNGVVVARANVLDSYSVNGQYSSRSLEMMNPFQNINGENVIDIVLYLGSKEVARVADYRLHIYDSPIVSHFIPNQLGIQSSKFHVNVEIINVDSEQAVEVYLIDKEGKKVTQTDKVISDHSNSVEKKRRVKLALSFIDSKNLKENEHYEYVVEVNGQAIKKYAGSPINTTSRSRVNVITHSSMPNLKYKVTGLNLLNQNPYRLVIEQDGIVTKELTDVAAEFNEKTYEEQIAVDLLPEYFAEYGGTYSIKLFDATDKVLNDFTFLVKKDDTSNVGSDQTNPLEGFKTFGKKENVEPNKTWRVKFNRPVDKGTINSSNTYIIQQKTGQSVAVNYALTDDGKELEITPEKNFISGEVYTLIIDKRVTSAGVKLSKPAAIEFTVK